MKSRDEFLKLSDKRWVNLEHVASVVDTSRADAPACKVRFAGSDEEHLSGEEAAALLEHLRPTPSPRGRGPRRPSGALERSLTMPADVPLRPCLSCRERLPRSRGLCPTCYDRSGRAVRAGETTWSALEAAGLALL